MQVKAVHAGRQAVQVGGEQYPVVGLFVLDLADLLVVALGTQEGHFDGLGGGHAGHGRQG
ncbi:Uncharacterised protein [Bordetella pertussis]|nr:Uncharacterised protein [Bordetella pertussis]